MDFLELLRLSLTIRYQNGGSQINRGSSKFLMSNKRRGGGPIRTQKVSKTSDQCFVVDGNVKYLSLTFPALNLAKLFTLVFYAFSIF